MHPCLPPPDEAFPLGPLLFHQNGAYIIKYVATAEETARLARVQAVGDWLAELVALHGLKEDAHEWGPAIEATLAPGTCVGVSVSAWCLCRVWSCVHDGPTLCNCLSLAGSMFCQPVATV